MMQFRIIETNMPVYIYGGCGYVLVSL